jgi:hypothetical protein
MSDINNTDDDLSWLEDINVPEDMDYNHYLAFMEAFDFDEVFGNNFEEYDYDHYGLKIYHFQNGATYAIGTERECDEALRDYWEGRSDDIDDEELSYWVYMTQTDRRIWAGDHADSMLESYSDEEVLDRMDYSELYDEIMALREQFEENETTIDELNNTEGFDDELIVSIAKLEEENVNIQNKVTELMYNLRSECHEQIRSDFYDCLEHPVECLVNDWGLYANTTDLIKSGVVLFDKERWVNHSIDNSDYSELAYWDGRYKYVYVDELMEAYYILRID